MSPKVVVSDEISMKNTYGNQPPVSFENKPSEVVIFDPKEFSNRLVMVSPKDLGSTQGTINCGLQVFGITNYIGQNNFDLIFYQK